MKRLLLTFIYNDILYEIYAQNNKLIINKNNQEELTEEDKILSIKVIKEILKKQNKKYDNIKYNNELIDIIYDELNDEYILKKDGYIYNNKYPKLYDRYNNPVYNDEEETLWVEDKSNIMTESNVSYDNKLNEEQEEQIRLENLKNNREKSKKTKKVLLSIGGVLLSTTVFVTSWNAWIKDISNKNSTIEITTPTQVVTEVQDKYIDEITPKEENLTEITPELETSIEDQNIDSKAAKIIETIKNNPYISDYYKDLLLPAYNDYINENIKYMTDEQANYIIDNLSTLKISEGYLNEDNTITGKYYYKSNSIYIYSDYEHTTTHEFLHSLGKYSVFTGNEESSAYVDYITEGYVEVHNVNRNKNVYSTAQMVYIALEKIYGKELMEKAFFGRSLLTELENQFGNDYESHWEFIKDMNEYLKMIGNQNVLDLREDEDLKPIAYEMVDRIKTEYESTTGNSWEDDDILKCIESCITGENTMNMDEHDFIVDVYLNEDGEYSYKTVYKENLSYRWSR